MRWVSPAGGVRAAEDRAAERPSAGQSLESRLKGRPEIRALAAGGSLTLAAGVTSALLGFGFALIVGRELGASGAGTFYQGVAVFSILVMVGQLGAPTALVRVIARQLSLRETGMVRPLILTAVVPSVLLACILAVALFIFAPQVSSLLLGHGDRGALTAYLRVLAFGVPVATATSVLLGATRGFGTMRPAALIDNVVRPVLRASLALAVFPFSRTGLAATAVWVAPLLLCFVLAVSAVGGMLNPKSLAQGARLGLSPSAMRPLWFEFWRFALPQSLTNLVQVALLWIDLLLLGALTGSHAAGVYAIATRYVLFGTLALSSLATAMAPSMSSLLTVGELARARDLFRACTAWAAAASLPIFVVMAVFAPVFVGFFGSSFAGGAAPLGILSLAMLANVLTGPAGLALTMGGKSGLVLLDWSVALAVNVTLDLLLIPRFGATGAALAWAVGIVVYNGLVSVQAYRRWKLNPLGRALLVIVCSSFVSYGALGLALAAFRTNPVTLLVTCLLGTALHVAVLRRLRLAVPFRLRRSRQRERRAPAPATALASED